MACRIRNLSRHPLRLDLLGGDTLHLPPGGVSGPLREERLVGNCYLREWAERGIARVESARMTEVLEAERRAAAGKPAGVAASPSAGRKEGPGAEPAERGEKAGQGAGSQKKPGGPKGR